MSRISGSRRVAVIAVTLGLFAAACSDDKTSSSTTTAPTGGSTETTGGSSETTGVAVDPLGTPKAAAGETITVGYISDGLSPALDNTDDGKMATLTADWINQYGGGIGGRKLKLEVCETKQDAALAADCSNKFITEGVAAVLVNVSGQAAALAKPLQDANIPLIVWQGASVATDAESSFVLANGLSALVEPAALARDNGYKKIAMIVVDVPEATGGAKALSVPFAKAAGAELTVVPVPPDASDLAPQIQAALSNNPDLVFVVANSSVCTAVFGALKDAGYAGHVGSISNCMEKATIDTLGSWLKGMTVGYAGTQDPADPDFALMQAIAANADKLGDPAPKEATGTAVGSFAVVMNFWTVLKDVTDPLTPTSVIQLFKTMPATHLYLGGGAQFKCDGKATILPGICMASYLRSVLDASGQPTTFTVVDPTSVMKLG